MKSNTRHQLIFVLICAFLSGCAATSVIHCLPGHEVAVNEQLYFGTDKPGGTVSAQEWVDFLRSSVTPRFPKGLTHWQATGQWQGKNGAVISENAYILTLIHPDDNNSETAVRSIADDYKFRFKQEAVLRVKDYSCIVY